MTDDFTLISVLDGARVSKGMLVSAVESGMLSFGTIDPAADPQIRVYGDAAITTNETRMNGEVQGQPWKARSRYVHVFVRKDGGWKMASAQGTPIT